MNAVAANLDVEATEWVASLHDEDSPELGNAEVFLEELWARFQDETRAQWAEVEIRGLKQRDWSVKEYVREFRRVAGKLRYWPERLLVYHFKKGFDKELRWVCIYRGSLTRSTNGTRLLWC